MCYIQPVKSIIQLAGGSSQVPGQSALFSNKTKQRTTNQKNKQKKNKQNNNKKPTTTKTPHQSQKGKYCIVPLI